MENKTSLYLAVEISKEMFPNWGDVYHHDLALRFIDLIKAVIKEEGEQK